MDEVAGDEVPVLLGLEVLALPRSVLVGTRDEAGTEADPACGGEIAVVGSDERDLRNLETEEVHGAQVALGLRLVVRVTSAPRIVSHGSPERLAMLTMRATLPFDSVARMYFFFMRWRPGTESGQGSRRCHARLR